MPKTKIWILVLLCAAGLMLVSCGQPKYRLRITMDESGYFPVDVARWSQYKDASGDVIFSYTVDDAVASIKVAYIGSIDELPTYPDHAIQLTSYKVTYKPSNNLQPVSGGLDQILDADPTGKTTVTFPVVVVPAGFKDSATVLSDLRGDPSVDDPNPFVGQLILKGTITVTGTDLTTGEQNINGSVDFTAAFADYLDPNKAH